MFPTNYKNMAKINMQKDKKKPIPERNVGGHAFLGADLNPNKDLCLMEDKERGQTAYYKGQKMNYMEYYGELGDRLEKTKKGKSLDNIGMFGGISFDKNGKIIKS